MDSGPSLQVNGQIMREAQPAYLNEFQRQITFDRESLFPSHESVLRDYVRVLIKRRWVVLTTLGVIFGVAAIATLRSTRIYEASGSIAINKPDPLTMLNFQGSSGPSGNYIDTSDLDTEVRILRSDRLALEVIQQLNLGQRTEFGGSGQPEPVSLGLTTDELQPDSDKTTRALGAFKRNLTVELVPDTRIIQISFRSPDKETAANVVNTLMQTYVEENFKSRYESTMQASDWLNKQLTDLEIKVETSQEKLVKYQKEHEILGLDDKNNIITAKLDELNKELTQAETIRMQKQAIYQLVQSQDQDMASAAAISVGDPGGVGPGGSNLLTRLREQEADLKIQVAQLSTQFGPSYPKVAELNNQLQEIETQIRAEMKKIVANVRGDYLAALNQENMLHAEFDQQKQQANELNQNAIQYNLLKRDVDTNRALYEDLLEKLKEAGVTAGLHSTNFRTVDTARVPTVPSEPNVPRNLAFALALGLTSGVGLAFLLEAIDNTVRTPEQAQIVSALPSLGMIPLALTSSTEAPGQRFAVTSSKETVELVTQSRPQSQMAESYRALRTSLLLTAPGAPPKIVLITSALPQEGKTTTSLNCAIVLAQKGSRVLLIDADLRRPSIHKAMGLGPRTGLSNVLTGSATLDQVIVRSSLLPTLFILPAGSAPPNPAELLASSNMQQILDALKQEYDHIVIDTPPTLSVTDAVLLSPLADAVVLVIRSGQTTKQALRRSRELLIRVNAHISGVLLNAADLHSPDYYYYYEYQSKYGNYYHRDEEEIEEEGELPEEQPLGGEESGSQASSSA